MEISLVRVERKKQIQVFKASVNTMVNNMVSTVAAQFTTAEQQYVTLQNAAVWI